MTSQSLYHVHFHSYSMDVRGIHWMVNEHNKNNAINNYVHNFIVSDSYGSIVSNDQGSTLKSSLDSDNSAQDMMSHRNVI